METFSALLAICAGNSPVSGEFPTQRPVTRRFDVYFDLRPDKRLSKQSLGWWFETLSHSLWRHRNGPRQFRASMSFVKMTENGPLSYHYDDVTWAFWRLTSLTIWLFVQRLVLTIKGSPKLHVTALQWRVSTDTGWFSLRNVVTTERVFMSWRHHITKKIQIAYFQPKRYNALQNTHYGLFFSPYNLGQP